MSLYHESAQILTTATSHGGSLKNIVFGKKDWKTDRKTLFALSTEAAKWSEVLTEVLESSEVLRVEKTLTPVLALVLTHDLLLSKKGVVLPAKHGLHSSIARHKARLSSELTKSRLRRGCPSLEALRDLVNAGNSGLAANASTYTHPRWIRVNTLLTTLSAELETTFQAYDEVTNISAVTRSGHSRVLFIDPNIHNLIAIPGNVNEVASSKAYKEGKLVFQEKASCFPAYLLDASSLHGDVIDACAAPGNKTTHLAAIIGSTSTGSTGSGRRRIFACEKDLARSQTLTKMVKLAGAGETVTVRAKQDFLRLDPSAPQFAYAEGLLLDPSCSGSGIVGRDEATVAVHLPSRDAQKPQDASRGKKRKRGQQSAEIKLDTEAKADEIAEETAPTTTDQDATKLASRLASLSFFQLRLLQHAMAFTAAKRISYSTCSLHAEENEHVVARALASDAARSRGWRILRREEQVEGLRKWGLRGNRDAVEKIAKDEDGVDEADAETAADACIRCEKGGEGGTMGFFVAAFVRDETVAPGNGHSRTAPSGQSAGAIEEDEWEGFSDDET